MLGYPMPGYRDAKAVSPGNVELRAVRDLYQQVLQAEASLATQTPEPGLNLTGLQLIRQ